MILAENGRGGARDVARTHRATSLCVGDMRQSYVIRSRFDGRGARTSVGGGIREGARGVRERPFLAADYFELFSVILVHVSIVIKFVVILGRRAPKDSGP